MRDNDSGECTAEIVGEAFPCPHCGGTGSVALLVTRRKCERCGGTGRLYPPASEDGPAYTIWWGDDPAGGPA